GLLLEKRGGRFGARRDFGDRFVGPGIDADQIAIELGHPVFSLPGYALVAAARLEHQAAGPVVAYLDHATFGDGDAFAALTAIADEDVVHARAVQVDRFDKKHAVGAGRFDETARRNLAHVVALLEPLAAHIDLALGPWRNHQRQQRHQHDDRRAEPQHRT